MDPRVQVGLGAHSTDGKPPKRQQKHWVSGEIKFHWESWYIASTHSTQGSYEDEWGGNIEGMNLTGGCCSVEEVDSGIKEWARSEVGTTIGADATRRKRKESGLVYSIQPRNTTFVCSLQ